MWAFFFKILFMAFTILRSDFKKETWHIQDKKPDGPLFVSKLWADGHELEYIKGRFDNLPMAHSHCVWSKDMAQFIYDNL
jgi:hypothetical protein